MDSSVSRLDVGAAGHISRGVTRSASSPLSNAGYKPVLTRGERVEAHQIEGRSKSTRIVRKKMRQLSQRVLSPLQKDNDVEFTTAKTNFLKQKPLLPPLDEDEDGESFHDALSCLEEMPPVEVDIEQRDEKSTTNSGCSRSLQNVNSNISQSSLVSSLSGSRHSFSRPESQNIHNKTEELSISSLHNSNQSSQCVPNATDNSSIGTFRRYQPSLRNSQNENSESDSSDIGRRSLNSEPNDMEITLDTNECTSGIGSPQSRLSDEVTNQNRGYQPTLHVGNSTYDNPCERSMSIGTGDMIVHIDTESKADSVSSDDESNDIDTQTALTPDDNVIVYLDGNPENKIDRNSNETDNSKHDGDSTTDTCDGSEDDAFPVLATPESFDKLVFPIPGEKTEPLKELKRRSNGAVVTGNNGKGGINISFARQELFDDDFDEYFERTFTEGYDNSVSNNDLPPTWSRMPSKSGQDGGQDLRAQFRREGGARSVSVGAARRRFKENLKKREVETTQLLQEKHGLSSGLAKVCFRSLNKFFIHIWIVDNSGSMATGDGRHFIDGAQKKIKTGTGRVSQVMTCTRWEELKARVLRHAELAADLGLPTVFRLMNNPNWTAEDHVGPKLPQFIGICAREVKANSSESNTNNLNTQTSLEGSLHEQPSMPNSNHDWQGVWEMDLGPKYEEGSVWKNRAAHDLAILRYIIEKTKPRFKTPLDKHIWAVHDQVKRLEARLKADQVIVVTIATDGMPGDKTSFRQAIRFLQNSPVIIVVILCTDNEDAMHFWKVLDLDYDISIIILDDFEAESESTNAMNSWVNYCMPMQKVRELGCMPQLFSILQVRRLSRHEMHRFCALIFGISPSKLTHPDDDWDQFYEDIQELVKRERNPWNPLRKKCIGWVSVKKIAQVYGGKDESARQKKVEAMKKERQHEKSRRRSSGLVNKLLNRKWVAPEF